jgi:hypothetical protein
MKLSLLADVLLVRDGSVGTTLGSSQRTSSLPREIWFVEVVVLVVFLILQGQLEHERFKVEHRILRIGLSFETLQQHSSFRPTSAQLGKSLKGPECIRAMLLQFWRRDKFPAIHHPRDFPSGKVPSIAFE